MDASQIADLFKFAIPFIIAYNAYIHNQVIKNSKDIAVNSANDESRVGFNDRNKRRTKSYENRNT